MARHYSVLPPSLPPRGLTRLQAAEYIGVGASKFDEMVNDGRMPSRMRLLFYSLEDRSHWFVLAFAGTCVLASTYGFLQGAWPFGVVEAIWAVVALRRWMRAKSS